MATLVLGLKGRSRKSGLAIYLAEFGDGIGKRIILIFYNFSIAFCIALNCIFFDSVFKDCS